MKPAADCRKTVGSKAKERERRQQRMMSATCEKRRGSEEVGENMRKVMAQKMSNGEVN